MYCIVRVPWSRPSEPGGETSGSGIDAVPAEVFERPRVPAEEELATGRVDESDAASSLVTAVKRAAAAVGFDWERVAATLGVDGLTAAECRATYFLHYFDEECERAPTPSSPATGDRLIVSVSSTDSSSMSPITHDDDDDDDDDDDSVSSSQLVDAFLSLPSPKEETSKNDS